MEELQTRWEELKNLWPEELNDTVWVRLPVTRCRWNPETVAEKIWLIPAKYEPGEVIAWQGDYGDRMVMLLEGCIGIYDEAFSKYRPRRIPHENDLDQPRSVGQLPRGIKQPPIEVVSQASRDRILGCANVLWNLPWPFTVVAGDSGCKVLLLKRVVFLETNLPEQRPIFWPWTSVRFYEHELPRMLMQNRLFEHLPQEERLGEIRNVLHSAEGDPGIVLYDLPIPHNERRKPLRHSNWFPLTRGTPNASRNGVQPADLTLFGPNHQPEGIYLILAGMVQITRSLGGPDGREVIVNQLGPGDFLGPGHYSGHDRHPLTATVVADAALIWLPATALANAPGAVRQALQQSETTQDERLRRVLDGHHYAPEGMSEEMASKLMLATDVLLIDMDACSRCDSCVSSCSQTHEGVTRFHRTNQKLHFGKWEVARACVHCIGAPCQAVCPHGAITLLESGIVQIHITTRCVGCQKCVPACPFDVISMQPPATGQQALSLPEKTKDIGVATKCDRCQTLDAQPACVTGCPYDAVRRGRPTELIPGLLEWATTR